MVQTRRGARSSLSLNTSQLSQRGSFSTGQLAHRSAAPSHRASTNSHRSSASSRVKVKTRISSKVSHSDMFEGRSPSVGKMEQLKEEDAPETQPSQLVLATSLSYAERAATQRHALWCEALQRDATRRAALETAWAVGRLSPPKVESPPQRGRILDPAREAMLQAMKPVDAAFLETYTTMYNWLDGYGKRPKVEQAPQPAVGVSDRSQSPPVRSPTFQQLLKPLVNSPSNRIFTCKHSLKLRQSYELDSPPAATEYLPAGSMVLVVERRTLPQGVERAAVKRVGSREGSLGWITVSRDDEASWQMRMERAAARKASRKAALEAAQAEAAAAAMAEAAGSTGSVEGAPAPADDAAAESAQAAAPAAKKEKDEVEKKEPSEKRPKGSKKKKDGDGGHGLSLTPSVELEALVRELKTKAVQEESKLDPSKKKLTVKLGEALLSRNTKIPELVASWAKRGVEPITKMQFRQSVRKLFEIACEGDSKNAVGSVPNVKEIDSLFEEFDDDKGGTLDVAELRNVLRGLKIAAVDAVKAEDPIRESAELYRQRARETQQVVDATRASELADARFEELRNNKSVGARLGALLQMRAIKIGDLTNRWDPDGNGIDMKEFVDNVLALGLDAQPDELNSLFVSLDEDGGGTLDGDELKHALKTLADAYEQAELDIVRLKKETVELAKVAKTAQVELRKQQKADEVEAAERQSAVEAERQLKEAEQRALRLERQAEIRAKREAKMAEQRAFEERVARQRQGSLIAASTGTGVRANTGPEKASE